MKILMCIVLLLSVSCIGKKVETLKVSAAEKIGAAMEKELSAQFVSISIQGVDCQAEAVSIGKDVAAKVKQFLKVKEQEKAVKSLALKGVAVSSICQFLVTSIVPGLIEDNASKYACIRALSSEKIVLLGVDLCDSINL